jgi:hypothetical protein
MNQNPTGFQLTEEEKNVLGIGQNPTVAQMKANNQGIGTSIPDYYVDKIQELAGKRQLTAKDIVMVFKGYLHLGEAPDAQRAMDILLGNILSEYLEWKDSKYKE